MGTLESFPPHAYGLTPRYAGGEISRWVVAVTRRGERFNKEFASADYGGADEARVAALAFRDDLLKTVPPMSLREFGSIVRSNNTSGMPGVYRREYKGFLYWCALVNLPNGKSRKRTFAIKKYGEERAKQLAIQARVELLKLLDGWLIQHPDALPVDQALPDVENCTPRSPKQRLTPAAPELSPEKRVYRMAWKRTLSDGRELSRDYWVAEYSTKSQPVRRKQFAVARYGEDEARRLAFEQRREWLAHPPGPSPRRAPRRRPDAALDQPAAPVSAAFPSMPAGPVLTSARPSAPLR